MNDQRLAGILAARSKVFILMLGLISRREFYMSRSGVGRAGLYLCLGLMLLF